MLGSPKYRTFSPDRFLAEDRGGAGVPRVSPAHPAVSWPPANGLQLRSPFIRSDSVERTRSRLGHQGREAAGRRRHLPDDRSRRRESVTC